MTDTATESAPVVASTVRVSLLRNRAVVQGEAELIADWSEESDECIWIDISAPTQRDIEPLLEEWFRFHELAAEDALSPTTLPKYDSFPRYDFFIFRTIMVNVAEHGIDSEKLACFLGKNFLFTIHNKPLEAVDAIWTRLPQDARLLESGVDFVLYNVLDYLVDAYFPLVEQIEERLDQIHETIFHNPAQRLLDELLDFKRDLNILRRQSMPQRDLLNQISRGEAKFIKPDHLIYFRDLYDHMYRIGEFVADERDMATSTMEAYLSVVANRTNDIMKVLTIFSSIMLPVNFIAGIYGMNFEFMPELHWKHGYLWAISLMCMVGVIMLSWFWKEGWILPKRRIYRTSKHMRRHRRRNGIE